MVSSLYHSFVSSRMSSLNFSMLGMLMTLPLLGLGHTSSIIFTVSNSWAPPMAIFLKLLRVFWWFLPPISWLLRHSSHLLEFKFVLVTAILGFIGEPPQHDSWLLPKIDHWCWVFTSLHKLLGGIPRQPVLLCKSLFRWSGRIFGMLLKIANPSFPSQGCYFPRLP